MICNVCLIDKPIGYRFNRFSQCRACYQKIYRKNNPDKIKKYAITQNKYQREYRKTHPQNLKKYYGRYKDKKREWNRKNRAINKPWKYQKQKARNAVYRALKSGKLIKKPCIKCGQVENVHGHHQDYLKPLEVIWLCFACHKKIHII